jgi:hypothetical protein
VPRTAPGVSSQGEARRSRNGQLPHLSGILQIAVVDALTADTCRRLFFSPQWVPQAGCVRRLGHGAYHHTRTATTTDGAADIATSQQAVGDTQDCEAVLQRFNK